MKIPRKKIILVISLAIFISLTYFLFNLKHLSRFIDSDIFAYTSNVEIGSPQYLFNPHHILFDYFGFAFYRLTGEIDNLGASVLFNQRLKSLLIASLGMGAIFLFLFFISRRIILSLSIALLIGFGRGYISYAALNDTPIIHSVLCIALFFLLHYYEKIKYKKWYAVFLGVFHALVIFFHQANVIFYFAALFFFLAANRGMPFKKRLLNLGIYSCTLMIIVASVYLYIGLFVIKTSFTGGYEITYFNIKGTGNFFKWLSFYANKNVWGAGLEGSNSLNKIVFGFSGAFVQGNTAVSYHGYYFDFTGFFSEKYAALNVTALIVTFSVICYGVMLKKLYKKHGAIIGSLTIWLVSYFVFFAWWEPDFFEFWLISASTVFILLFFVLNYFLDRVKDFFLVKKMINGLIFLVLFCYALIVVNTNYTHIVYPRSVYPQYGWLGIFKERSLQLNHDKMYRELPR